MDAKQLEETLAAIASKAKALRDAGVVGRLEIGEITFELAAVEPPRPVLVDAPVSGRGNAFEEPNTFGVDVDDDIPRRKKAPRAARGRPAPDED